MLCFNKKYLNKIFITCWIFSSSVSALTNDKNYDVIVIGAGVSGLSAANYLVQHHIPTLVLEARNRIGGRINTNYSWGPGLDLGASWIHGIKNNPVDDLIKKLKITTLPTYYNDNVPIARFKSNDFYDSDGKQIPQVKMNKIIPLAERFDKFIVEHKKEFKNVSVDDALTMYINKNHINDQDAFLLRYVEVLLYTYEYAADTRALSANADTPYDNSEVEGRNEVLPYGYNQILPNLEKDVPIKLNQVVNKIEYGVNGVDIYTQDAKHYHANYVIITVPLGVLKSGKIAFNPALPTDKQQSINDLKMGVYDKVYMLFDHPFWNIKREWVDYIPSANDLNNSADIMNYYPATKMPVLLMFTGGSSAANLESLSDQATVDHMMAILKKIYGNDIPQPISFIITRWNNDPYTQGSYSYLPTGVDKDAYAIMAKPVANQLFFAGEATSATDPSTVHGAYATGIRAAKEVQSSIASGHGTQKLG